MPSSVAFHDKKEHIAFSAEPTAEGYAISVVMEGKPQSRIIPLYPNRKAGDGVIVKYVADDDKTFHVTTNTMAFMWGVVGPHIYENRKITLHLDTGTFLYELPEPFTHTMAPLFDGPLDGSTYKIYMHKGEKKVKKMK
jgi:hypothetical protein